MPVFRRPGAPRDTYLVKGLVYNVKNNMPVEAQVIFRSTSDSTMAVQDTAGSDGQYELNVPPGTYEVYAQKDGYAAANQQQITLGEIDPNQDGVVVRDLYLSNDFSAVNIREELSTHRRAVASEEVLFDLNSAQLGRKSYRQLKDVAAFMQENPEAELRIAGHTCSRGTDTHNQQLSEQRAQAVANYLARQGVTPSRIQSVGYGESQPLVANSSEANRSLNRRVEFELVD